jgi:DNA-binding transcriptional LysR family regulator
MKYPNIDFIIRFTTEKAPFDPFLPYDIGITHQACSKLSGGVHSHRIGSYDPFILLPLRHPLSFRNEITMKDLEKEVFYAVDCENDFCAGIHARFVEDNGNGPKNIAIRHVPNITTALFSVSCGKGFTVLPQYMIPAMNEKTFIALRLNHPGYKCNLYLLWKEESFNPAARLFLEEYKDYQKNQQQD